MAEIQSVLRRLEQFETLMQEIYALLAKRFGADADAAALFTRLAFEERSHVGQVQFLRRLARQNPSHFTEVDVDLEAIQKELQQIERVHGAVGELSLREAVVLPSSSRTVWRRYTRARPSPAPTARWGACCGACTTRTSNTTLRSWSSRRNVVFERGKGDGEGVRGRSAMTKKGRGHDG